MQNDKDIKAKKVESWLKTLDKVRDEIIRAQTGTEYKGIINPLNSACKHLHQKLTIFKYPIQYKRRPYPSVKKPDISAIIDSANKPKDAFQ